MVSEIHQSENSQDYAQKPQRYYTFMNSAFGIVVKDRTNVKERLRMRVFIDKKKTVSLRVTACSIHKSRF
jgi:hypothetical protein